MDSISITSCITLDMRISPIEMLNRTRETDADDPVYYYAWYNNGHIQRLGEFLGIHIHPGGRVIFIRFKLMNREYTFRFYPDEGETELMGFLAMSPRFANRPVSREFIMIHKNIGFVIVKCGSYIRDADFYITQNLSFVHRSTPVELESSDRGIKVSYPYNAHEDSIRELMRKYTPGLNELIEHIGPLGPPAPGDNITRVGVRGPTGPPGISGPVGPTGQ